MTFEHFCERVRNLKRAQVDGTRMPYKPLLVAAAIILIHKRKIQTPDVFLDGGLKSAFHQLLGAVYPDWRYDAKPEYPFRHLASDGVWALVPREGRAEALEAARSAKPWAVLRHVACARLDAEVFDHLACRLEARLRVLQLLWDTYLPPTAAAILMRYIVGPDLDAGGGSVSVAAERQVLTEKALEEHLERNWAETPFAERGVQLSSRVAFGYAGRQVLTPVNAIDLLGYQPVDKCWWVFELKRGRAADRVVGQVSRYLGWVLGERAGHGEHAVGAIIARRADRKLRYAVHANPRLSLWEYDDDLRLRAVAE
jgi:hypothetical protein